ncbi:MAG TPA: DUF2508 family protein [Acetivibrio clariflavus]|nr:DUF2508 family protein [Acetivibrio clariflavus]
MNLNIQKQEKLKEHKSYIFQRVFNFLNIIKSNEFTEKDAFETQNLIDSITKAKKEWIEASEDFNYAVDKEMIDYFTYKIKAYEARYEYLLRIAKEKGIKYDAKLTKK